jgi:HD-GYP domain-containing protein (c-di-GMP phosphodiesterase class II)
MMTGQMEISIAVAAINQGQVFRFVCKPLDLNALIAAIRLAIEHYASLKTRERLTREMLEQNRNLRRTAEIKESSLRHAERKIRDDAEKAERQKAHIDELRLGIERAYLDTVSALIAAMEARDRYTRGHSERVNFYCSRMADILNLSEQAREDLHLASLLHDLGKIGIPDEVLHKAGPLTAAEIRVIERHPVVADDILRPLPFLKTVRKIIREHHEHFDGCGYPNRLKGDQISFEGRILSVADAFDAMRSDRAYRKALPEPEALMRIQMGAGGQFCPVSAQALQDAVIHNGSVNVSKIDTFEVNREVQKPLGMKINKLKS